MPDQADTADLWGPVNNVNPHRKCRSHDNIIMIIYQHGTVAMPSPRLEFSTGISRYHGIKNIILLPEHSNSIDQLVLFVSSCPLSRNLQPKGITHVLCQNTILSSVTTRNHAS